MSKRPVIYALILGLLFWVIDAGIDAYVFSELISFKDAFAGHVPVDLTRVMVLVLMVGVGLHYSNALHRLEQRFKRKQEDLENLEQNTKRSINQLTALINCTSDMALLKDREGRFVVVNEALAKALGASRESMPGKTDFDFFPKNLSEKYRLDDLRVFESGQSVRVQEPFKDRDGKISWVETIKNPVFNDKGEVEHVALVSRDMTERRQIEAELQYERMLLEAFLDNSVDFIYFKDRDSRFIRVNRAWVRAWGGKKVKKPEDIIGMSDYDFFTKDAAETKFKDEQEIIKSGSPLYGKEELDVPADGGEPTWQYTVKMPLKDREGRTIGTFGVTRDITQLKKAQEALLKYQAHLENVVRDRTSELEKSNRELEHDISERKLAEERLRRSEEHLETILNSIADSVIATDAHGIITKMNVQAEVLTGWPASQAEGKKLSDVYRTIDEKTRQIVENPVDLAARTGVRSPHLRSLILTNRDNRECTIDEGVALIRTAGEQARGAVIVFRDTTEQKKLEKQLRQSERLQVIGQLAGGVAHDFNNQITGIMGCAEMLRILVDNEEIQRYVEMIMTSAGRSADLTQKLLAFARRGTFQMVPVDVHKVVEEVIALLERTIDRRIHLTQELYASPCMIKGDPTQIQNALLNIAINARDAIVDSGRVTFATRTVALDERFLKDHAYGVSPGRYVEITISDTGMGMSEETQAHLFEPFFTTKKNGKGNGMGLAAVYGTVKSHKGAITAQSQLGKGSSFKLYLPLSDEDGAGKGKLSEAAALVRGSAQILLIDDEEIVRKVASDMLNNLGYKVTMCSGGKEGIEYYENNWRNVDLVILDMVMPDLSGKDVFLSLFKINPKIRALLASGYSLNRNVQEIIDKGSVSFMKKPFLMTDLARKVAEALKPNQQRLI